MASNVKGWIGFLVLVIIVIGGAFGTSHILPSKASALTIKDMTSSVSGQYVATNSTYYINLTSPASSITFNVTVSAPIASGNLTAVVIPPAILNQTLYNLTENATYSKLIAPPYNMTAANATLNASTVAYEASTFNLFNETTVNTTLSKGAAVVTFTVSLNKTALSLMARGQTVLVSFTASALQYGVVGSILITKDY